MVHWRNVDPQIGPYRIESELGRGGMGVVYVARKGPLRREVAVKMVLPEGHNDAGLRARFVAERHRAGGDALATAQVLNRASASPSGRQPAELGETGGGGGRLLPAAGQQLAL